MPGERLHAGLLQALGQTQPVQDSARVGRQLQGCADLGQGGRLLVHVDVEAGIEQGQGSREPPDPRANDRDRPARTRVTSHPQRTPVGRNWTEILGPTDWRVFGIACSQVRWHEPPMTTRSP